MFKNVFRLSNCQRRKNRISWRSNPLGGIEQLEARRLLATGAMMQVSSDDGSSLAGAGYCFSEAATGLPESRVAAWQRSVPYGPQQPQASALGFNGLESHLSALPQKTGQHFMIDDWDFDVTRNDLGFNYFGGNTGNTEEIEGTTELSVASESFGGEGGSLKLAFDFTGQDNEVFAGYFASLFGLTDTLVSLDGSGIEPSSATPFPGYSLDMLDLYSGFIPFANRSIEELQFEVRLESPQNVTFKIELRDENGLDVFTRYTVTNTGNWESVSLALPGDFTESVEGNPLEFNWHEVSTIALIVERNNFGAGVQNPDTGTILLDNLRLFDSNGAYPDLQAARDTNGTGVAPEFEDAFLDFVRAGSSQYFLDWSSTDPRSGGIIQDRSSFADLLTVGGAGFQLSSYVVSAERGYISRAEAAERVRNVLRVLYDNPQGPERVGTTGNEGFFYHFLGIDGLRKQNFDFIETSVDESLNTVEVSTIDTALAIAGAVTAGQYFNHDTMIEREIRQIVEEIYGRVNWAFMLDDERFTNTSQFFLGWKPLENRDDDSGMYGRFKLDDNTLAPTGQFSSKPDANNAEIPATIDFYTDEGLLIALLAMGSPNPNHRLGREVWDAMLRDTGGGSFIRTFPGALFTYQFASIWLDTEGLGIDNHQSVNGQPARPTDFFANTRDAILSTREYTLANPEDRATWREGGGAKRWGVSAAEGPFDDYFASGAPTAALAIDGGIVAHPGSVSTEFEDGTGDGNRSSRSNAAGGLAVQLNSGESRSVSVDVPFRAEYGISIVYSNDNFGPLEQIDVHIDNVLVGSFSAQDTGDFGAGWNTFVVSELLGLIHLQPGIQTISVSVVGGDGGGVELDHLNLQHGLVLRGLEDGTATVYGAGSAIKHVPDLAIAALWESFELGLLHPRFGFADAFNLDISQTVIDETQQGEILRTTGKWVNPTGFSIDHGPMALAIDNYLTDNFTPKLFMSHPTISKALGQLFSSLKSLTVTLSDALISENSPQSVIVTVAREDGQNAAELVLRIDNGDPSEIRVPQSFVIPAGQSEAIFEMVAVDDTLLDGSQFATLTISAPGYITEQTVVEISDHETLTVSLHNATTFESGIVTATVIRSNSDISSALNVSLISSDLTEATTPSQVTIPADGQSTSFQIVTLNDGVADGSNLSLITAKAEGYQSISAQLEVVENPFPWQNPFNRLDVDRDGFIVPADVLQIVNSINGVGSRALPYPSEVPVPFYYDTNGDDFISPIDVLLVVNFLNAIRGAALSF